MTLTLTEPGPGRGYQVKTIKAILARKARQWLDSIEDVGLRRACERDAIITGGSIVSLLTGEEVNDFDIYMQNIETTKQLAEYYVEKFSERRRAANKIGVPLTVEECTDVRGKPRIKIVVRSSGVTGEDGEGLGPDRDFGEEVVTDAGQIQDLTDDTETASLTDTTPEEKKQGLKPYRPVFLSTNAITLADKVQIVLRFYGTPEEIHSTFDFAHTTCYFRVKDSHLELPVRALTAIMSKTLVYQGSLYPVCSIFRLRKFIARGWRVSAGSCLKMAYQISHLNLDDLDVLEDQTSGVDAAYMAQLMDRLRAKDPDKVDSAYLVEVLDELFDDA